MLIALKPEHAPDREYMQRIRARAGATSSPARRSTSSRRTSSARCSTSGCRAPIDVQIEGPDLRAELRAWRRKLRDADPRRSPAPPTCASRRSSTTRRSTSTSTARAPRSSGCHRARRGQQPAHLAVLELAGRAVVLDQPAEQRELLRGGADAARGELDSVPDADGHAARRRRRRDVASPPATSRRAPLPTAAA